MLVVQFQRSSAHYFQQNFLCKIHSARIVAHSLSRNVGVPTRAQDRWAAGTDDRVPERQQSKTKEYKTDQYMHFAGALSSLVLLPPPSSSPEHSSGRFLKVGSRLEAAAEAWKRKVLQCPPNK